ncbi:TetR family transcriptional regulator [Streptomyces sp. NPDC018000]|uniref:TetR family transcriptional regulator n=1 Tax=Streptomyces sp. NPDC018000 TaxID=3365028 RepID=UPI00379985F6
MELWVGQFFVGLGFYGGGEDEFSVLVGGAAAEMFAREAFAPASLTAISRRAGVSNGALHFHFENKKVLARAVEEEAIRTVRGIARKALGGQDGGLRVLVEWVRWPSVWTGFR